MLNILNHHLAITRKDIRNDGVMVVRGACSGENAYQHLRRRIKNTFYGAGIGTEAVMIPGRGEPYIAPFLLSVDHAIGRYEDLQTFAIRGRSAPPLV